MKLTIKTLQQTTFKVEVEPDITVKDLKEKIQKEQGKEYPSAAQKLIYSGKILADENKLSEYQFDEKKFVVLMITRPPPVVKNPVESEKQEVKKEDQNSGSKAKTASEDDSKSSTSTTQPSTAKSTIAKSSTNTTTETSTTTLSTTTNQSSTTNSAPSPARQPSSGRQSAMSDISHLPASELQAASRLAAMMSQPHFEQMQDLIQQSPHLLSSTIEALAASDPEMYNFISENPDVFVNALNRPPQAGSRMHSSRGFLNAGQRGAEQQAVGGQGGGRQQPVVDQILGDVSEHDKEAIERLKELGFSEYLAVQAYMACDKDEQLAANLLFQMEQ